MDSIARVSKPDRSVRMLDNIIGAVQPVTVVRGCQDFHRAVVLGSDHAALAVLTRHESARPVHRATVCEAVWGEEDISALAHLVITEDSIVRDVAEQQESASRVVAGSLQPSTTREEPGGGTVPPPPHETPIPHLKLRRDEIGHGSSCLVGFCTYRLRRLYRQRRQSRTRYALSFVADSVAIIQARSVVGLLVPGVVAQPVRAGDS